MVQRRKSRPREEQMLPESERQSQGVTPPGSVCLGLISHAFEKQSISQFVLKGQS